MKTAKFIIHPYKTERSIKFAQIVYPFTIISKERKQNHELHQEYCLRFQYLAAENTKMTAFCYIAV
jgi:hypothetical protein